MSASEMIALNVVSLLQFHTLVSHHILRVAENYWVFLSMHSSWVLSLVVVSRWCALVNRGHHIFVLWSHATDVYSVTQTASILIHMWVTLPSVFLMSLFVSVRVFQWFAVGLMDGISCLAGRIKPVFGLGRVLLRQVSHVWLADDGVIMCRGYLMVVRQTRAHRRCSHGEQIWETVAKFSYSLSIPFERKFSWLEFLCESVCNERHAFSFLPVRIWAILECRLLNLLSLCFVLLAHL